MTFNEAAFSASDLSTKNAIYEASKHSMLYISSFLTSAFIVTASWATRFLVKSYRGSL